MSMEDPKEVDDTLYIVDVQQRQGINYFLIESIISRAGNTLKLRFLDGSIGELDFLEAFGYEGEVRLQYRVLWGENGQPICEAEDAYMNATFPKREWPLSPEQSEAAGRWLENPTPMKFL